MSRSSRAHETVNPRTDEVGDEFTPRAVAVRNHIFDHMQWPPLVDVELLNESGADLFVELGIDLDPGEEYTFGIPESQLQRLGIVGEIITIKTGTPGRDGQEPAFVCKVDLKESNIEQVESNTLAES